MQTTLQAYEAYEAYIEHSKLAEYFYVNPKGYWHGKYVTNREIRKEPAKIIYAECMHNIHYAASTFFLDIWLEIN